jgi:hypothetical protein
MLGCHRHYLDTLTSRSDAHLIYLLECDNTAGESWLTKGCTSSPTGRELARLQATLLLDHGAGFHFGRANTKSNVIADGISRIPSESSLSNDFPILLSQAPSLLGCRRFLPNAGFISLIADVLLRTASWDPLTVSRQLLTDPGRFISYLGATDVGLPDPCTLELPLQGRNWVMACYMVWLIHGHTINGVRIRYATLHGYIRQAMSLHNDRGLPNPHGTDINYVKIMTNTVKKYESVPKCKEMISDSMFHYIADLSSCASEDSLIHAISDWIVLGSYTDFRKSEWCSNHSDSFAWIDDPNWGNRPTALPVIVDDFTFSSTTGRQVHDLAMVADS